jgi:hypothetical protein
MWYFKQNSYLRRKDKRNRVWIAGVFVGGGAGVLGVVAQHARQTAVYHENGAAVWPEKILQYDSKQGFVYECYLHIPSPFLHHDKMVV